MSPTAAITPDFYDAGHGSTIVLLHGFGASWHMWKPLLPLLEKHHRVFAPTVPGHVGGLPLTRSASPVNIAEALAAQLRAQNIDQAHFVGQSMGGWLVWEMVRAGLARSGLGLSPAGAWRHEEKKVAFMRTAKRSFRVLPYLLPVLSLAVGSRGLRKRILANEMEHGERVPAAEVRSALQRIRRLTIVEEYLDEGLQQVEPLPIGSTVPLRVVWGGSDRTLGFEEFGEPLLERLRLDSHVTLPGCGHNPLYDDLPAVASTILDFTRAVDAEAT